ncbi:MAG: DUF5906 domain-containing protein [Nitrososphaerota archaeon]|jgi:P4 family phage/plasmid primase-like protien|nr:DUF5906 domain-containing protein [Nitrososphaerota archaeon]
MSSIDNSNITNLPKTHRERVKDAATFWHQQGLPAIPIEIGWNKANRTYDKIVKVSSYAQWHNQPQTQQEFDTLNWQYNGYGIITTNTASNGYYLRTIDYDPKHFDKLDISDEEKETRKAAGLKILHATVEAYPSFTEKTPNGGIHVRYWSRKNCQHIQTYLEATGLELLGGRRYLATYPSEHYSILEDQPIAIVDDIEAIFHDAMKKHQTPSPILKLPQTEPSDASADNKKTADKTLPPCIATALKQSKHPHGGYGHLMNLAIAAHMKKAKYTDDEIIEAFLQFEDPDLNKISIGVDSADPAKAAGCTSIKTWNYCTYTTDQTLCPWRVAQAEQQRKQQYRTLRSCIQDIDLPLYEKKEKLGKDGKPQTKTYVYPAPYAAQKILKHPNLKIVTDGASNTIWVWIPSIGIYSRYGRRLLRTLIKKGYGPHVKMANVEEVIKNIEADTDSIDLEPSDKVAVQNGILNITVHNVNLESFTREEFITEKINVTYNKDAKSESWLNFIDQVCPRDKGTLQEWAGYFLVKSMPMHALMWLYGALGRNGKGTFVRVMQAILGSGNYSNISLPNLAEDRPYALPNLEHKYANFCSEPPVKRDLSIENLKSITGGDSMGAEKKNVQDRIELRNHAKITVMGNQFPNLIDPDEAFWERYRCCEFPNTFTGDKQIANIEHQWIDDPDAMSAILNWMIEGLQRLIENGWKFTESQSIAEKKRRYGLMSNSVEIYLEEHTEVDDGVDSYVVGTKLREGYNRFCKDNKVRPKSDYKKRVENFGDGSVYYNRVTTVDKDGGRPYVWFGLRLKNNTSTKTSDISDKPDNINDKNQSTLDEAALKMSNMSGMSNSLVGNEKIDAADSLLVPSQFHNQPVPSAQAAGLNPKSHRVCGGCAKYKQDCCRYVEANAEPPYQKHPRFNENYADSNYANDCKTYAY